MAKAAKTDDLEPLIDLRRAPPKKWDNGKRRRAPKHGRTSLKKAQARVYCSAETQAGAPCPQFAQRVTLRGKRYQLKTCIMHASDPIKKELGLIGHARGGPGRKKHPTAPDILRERFEADARRYLKPYEDALEAMRAVVVGNGASAHIQMVADLTTRLKASEAILDRVVGKPKQITELTGGDAPLEIVVPTDHKRERDVAAILAESGALGTAIPANPSAISPTTN